MVVALLLALADHAARSREVDALVRRVAAAQEAAVYADRRLAGTVQYVSGSLNSPSVPQPVRTDLRRLVQQEAAGQVPVLRAARAEVARVRPLPWHRAVRTARAAALAHLDARVTHLEAVTVDLRALYVPRSAVTGSAVRARAALAAAGRPGRAARLYP